MEAETPGTAPLSGNAVQTSRGVLPVPVRPTPLRRRRRVGRRILATAAIVAAVAVAVGVRAKGAMGCADRRGDPSDKGRGDRSGLRHGRRGGDRLRPFRRDGRRAREHRFWSTKAIRARRGDVLARLDDRQPLARLDDARARLRMAEADIARAETLLKRGVVAVQALERAQQERDQAASAVALFARQLEDYTITSPLDGVVMKRNVEPGETVPANTVLFEISSTARMRIAADVDERDIAGVRMGAALAAHADGFPDEVFEAKVTNIRRQGDASSRTFRVEAGPAVGNEKADDRHDGRRRHRHRREAEDALPAPASAIGHGPSTGGRPGAPYIVVVQEGHARRVVIETGAVGPARSKSSAGPRGRRYDRARRP